MHNLFHTLMPYQQQISSVLETQYQVSSGKIKQALLLFASLLANHLPVNQ